MAQGSRSNRGRIVAKPRTNTAGLHRLAGRFPEALSGQALWTHSEKARKLKKRGKRICVVCDAPVSTYNPNDVCWCHDYQDQSA